MQNQRKPNEIRPLKAVILRVDIPTGVCVVDRLAEFGLKCPEVVLPKPKESPPEHPDLSFIYCGRVGRQLVQVVNGLRIS
jgi:hypothetical protein